MGSIVTSQVSTRRLRQALFLYLATALLVLLFSIAITISLTLFNHMKDAEHESTIHAAQTRAMVVAEWCRRAKDLALQITSRSRIRQELEKHNQGLVSFSQVRAFTEPKLADAMKMSEDILGVLRFDIHHHVIAACGLGAMLPINDTVVDKYIFDDMVLMDPITVNGRSVIVVSAPIRNRTGERLGTDLVILGINRLLSIESNSKIAGTIDNVAIGYQSNDAIEYLFPFKPASLAPQSASAASKAIDRTISKAIAGQRGIETLGDMLIAYVPVSGSNWGLVTIQDQGALYLPLYRKMGTIGILFFVIYLLVVFGFGVAIKPMAGRILLHSDDLEIKISEKTAALEDEIRVRKDAEIQLQEKEKFLAAVFDSIQDGISVLDPDLKIVRTNKAMQAWYAEHLPLEGNVCFGVYYDRDKPCTDCPVLRSIKSRHLEMQEVSLIQGGTQNGTLEVYAFPMIDSNDTITGVVEYVRDVSKQKQAEKALADSERHLSDIIEFLPDPTWVIDAEGRVIAWNRAIERMTGIEKKEMLGKGDYAYAVPFYGEPRPVLIDLVLHRDEKWESAYLAFKDEDGILVEVESFNPLLGEDGLYLAGSAGRLYDSMGNVVGAIETIRDITDAKRLEKEREQLIADMKEAIATVRTLSGLLPMCANCKKVRDDSGYWNQLESYISQHTDADISHGVCPECMEIIYGGQDWYEKGKNKGKC